MIGELTFKIGGVTYVEREGNGSAWLLIKSLQGIYSFRYRAGDVIVELRNGSYQRVMDGVKTELAAAWIQYVSNNAGARDRTSVGRRNALMKAFKRAPIEGDKP